MRIVSSNTENSRDSKIHKVIPLIMSLALLGQVSGFLYWFPYVHLFYYIALFLSLFYLLGGGVRLNMRFAIFLIIVGLNAFLLPIDQIFNSKIRYLFFLFVMLVCSPLLQSARAVQFRNNVFKYTLLGLTLLVIGSFVSYFIGVNFMPYNRVDLVDSQLSKFADYKNNGGSFSGLFTHSMMLGPLASLVAIFFFIYYLRGKQKKFMWLFFISAFSVILSASRASLLSLAIPIAYLICTANNNVKSYKQLIVLFIIGLIVVVPMKESLFSGIIDKQEKSAENYDGIFDSRNTKFEARINEFKDSPIVGIGFSSVDGRYDYYNTTNGQIEPGSSHLAVLSMTGIIGFISYLCILYYAFVNTKRRNDIDGLFFRCLFLSFITHICFEGYIFGVGGSICFLLWLVISLCYNQKQCTENDNSLFYKYT